MIYWGGERGGRAVGKQQQKKKEKKNTHADLSPEVETQVLCC